MRIILDANSLIYLVKTNLFLRFRDLISHPIVIDTSVYQEVVKDGIAENYPDAYVAKKYLEDFNIDIISVDISEQLPFFRDPGETSSYLLAQDNGVCVTSDNRATKKMMNHGIVPISLDEYFYNLCLNGLITSKEFEDILDKFVEIYASTNQRRNGFLTQVKELMNNE